jgi:hypothetical protein
MSANSVKIELTSEQALVLFDWLGRFNADPRGVLFEDQAEERVLWDLEATLERVLVEPFAANYRELLGQARERVRDRE